MRDSSILDLYSWFPLNGRPSSPSFTESATIVIPQARVFAITLKRDVLMPLKAASFQGRHLFGQPELAQNLHILRVTLFARLFYK